MKKRLVSVVLSLAMVATLFAGCGSGDDAGNAGGGTADTAQTESTEAGNTEAGMRRRQQLLLRHSKAVMVQIFGKK